MIHVLCRLLLTNQWSLALGHYPKKLPIRNSHQQDSRAHWSRWWVPHNPLEDVYVPETTFTDRRPMYLPPKSNEGPTKRPTTRTQLHHPRVCDRYPVSIASSPWIAFACFSSSLLFLLLIFVKPHKFPRLRPLSLWSCIVCHLYRRRHPSYLVTQWLLHFLERMFMAHCWRSVLLV